MRKQFFRESINFIEFFCFLLIFRYLYFYWYSVITVSSVQRLIRMCFFKYKCLTRNNWNLKCIFVETIFSQWSYFLIAYSSLLEHSCWPDAISTFANTFFFISLSLSLTHTHTLSLSLLQRFNCWTVNQSFQMMDWFSFSECLSLKTDIFIQ